MKGLRRSRGRGCRCGSVGQSPTPMGRPRRRLRPKNHRDASPRVRACRSVSPTGTGVHGRKAGSGHERATGAHRGHAAAKLARLRTWPAAVRRAVIRSRPDSRETFRRPSLALQTIRTDQTGIGCGAAHCVGAALPESVPRAMGHRRPSKPAVRGGPLCGGGYGHGPSREDEPRWPQQTRCAGGPNDRQTTSMSAGRQGAGRAEGFSGCIPQRGAIMRLGEGGGLPRTHPRSG